MSYFRKTKDFDLCYIEEYEEELREHNRRERERRERAKQKDRRRAEFIKEWNDLNG